MNQNITSIKMYYIFLQQQQEKEEEKETLKGCKNK
jgi:hypothetical protein